MALVPPSLLAALGDRYRLERELGQGGMGVVYLAREIRHDRQVAIKVLRPELANAVSAERFLREIRIAANLHHPHVLQLHDSGEAAGVLYYVMPFVDGESLRQRLDREKSLEPREALRILRDVADALVAAHRQGVVHRDLKPDNILLADRHAFIADFGVARALAGVGGAGTLTSVGMALGTPAYMSPEQAAGAHDVDGRADLYALGVIGYQMLCGHLPIEGATAQQVMARQVTERPIPLLQHAPMVPQPLGESIMRCLEKRPEDRWSSAEELLGVLEQLSSTSGEATPTGAQLVPRWRARLWSRGWVVAGAVTLLAGTVVAVRELRRPPPLVPVQRQLTFSGRVVDAAISPDGQFVAYIEDEGAQHRLAVQDLTGGSEVELLRRSSPLAGVGWSPDSRDVTVALLSGVSVSELLSVPRLGGAVRSFSGGLWTRWAMGGQLLRFNPPFAGFYLDDPRTSTNCAYPVVDSLTFTTSVVMSAVTGAVALVRTGGEQSGMRVYAGHPRAGCDAETRTGSWDDLNIVLASAVSDVSMSWAPGGKALYVVMPDSAGNGGLFRVPVGRRGGGPPRLLLSGVEPSGPQSSGPQLTSAADTPRLVYVGGRSFGNLLQVSWASDGSITFRSLTTGTIHRAFARVSPDGRQVAFVQSNGIGRGEDIYVLDRETGVATRATFEGSIYSKPAWSPDGTSLAVVVLRAGGQRVATFVPGQVGSLRVYEETRPGAADLTWSPGPRIIYNAIGSRNSVLLNSSDGSMEPLLRGADSTRGWFFPASVSPDGAQLVAFFNTGYPCELGYYVVSLNDRSMRLVLNVPAPDPEVLGWNTVGSEFFVLLVGDQKVVAVGLDGKVRDLGALSGAFPGAKIVDGSVDREGTFFLTSETNQTDAWMVEDFDPYWKR